ncbi:hypothetical protein SAMN06265360_10654 [Haloechinothrix alba]|uniref:Uncharacterized protein n=1 Tax=Haloechinothrix alba TaxID=664784 RepID=A0A238WFM5_9PSEU|nr:hypothetical protein [Haloechinothrix alba]SNR44489.1 hypothetical protein SAMN06265360_10654 [Haloechinothrix alba]
MDPNHHPQEYWAEEAAREATNARFEQPQDATVHALLAVRAELAALRYGLVGHEQDGNDNQLGEIARAARKPGGR